MVITATEAKANFGKYIQLAAKEDIYITKIGYTVCRLTKPEVDVNKVLDEISGVLPVHDVDEDALRTERLSRQ